MRLDDIPSIPLAHLPTPIDNAPRLAEHLGLSSLLIKRDDQTGLALGGNKARKLEYLMADALSQGCDTILTNGGPQSNHARMTAAAARKLGLDVKLCLAGPDFDDYQGNLLLDVVFGADILFLKGKDVPEMEAELVRMASELRKQGRKPYHVPIGGSTPIGALGYVRGIQELRQQIGDVRAQIVLAVGSCGTMAGCLLGQKLYMPRAEVLGVSVSRSSLQIQRRVVEIANASSELIEADITFAEKDVRCYDEYYGTAYGVPTDSGKDAIITCARTEGLLLDPVYTGKAMAGLFDLAHKGILDPQRPVVFLHTGGTAALFAFEKEFHDLAVCEKVE